MVKVEHVKTYNWIDAMRGMRNPKNSWSKNDTTCECDVNDGHAVKVSIGPNDMNLAGTLIRCGTEHRKFLRQIHVSLDITIPMYVVQEFDTYKLGTTRNSCSFQHKGASSPFTIENFSFDDETQLPGDDVLKWQVKDFRDHMLQIIEQLRQKFNETGDYKYFRLLRQYIPMGLNMKFTWTSNYEVLLNMYKQRKNHKLQEWHEFCDALLAQIPYFKEFTEFAENKM